jgi:hypothetical protein
LNAPIRCVFQKYIKRISLRNCGESVNKFKEADTWDRDSLGGSHVKVLPGEEHKTESAQKRENVGVRLRGIERAKLKKCEADWCPFCPKNRK